MTMMKCSLCGTAWEKDGWCHPDAACANELYRQLQAERERCARIIEATAMPKEYEGVAGFRPWNEVVKMLADEIRGTGDLKETV